MLASFHILSSLFFSKFVVSIHSTQCNVLLTTSLHKLQITLQNISYVRDFHGGEDLRLCSEAFTVTIFNKILSPHVVKLDNF